MRAQQSRAARPVSVRCSLSPWRFFPGVLAFIPSPTPYTLGASFRGRSVSPMHRLHAVAGSSSGKKERCAVAK